jgi:hypothetical protein
MTVEELYNRVGQLLAGWKQGCAPGEWTDFDESVLRDWQSWRVSESDRQQRIDFAIRALEKKAHGTALAILKFGIPPNEPVVLAGCPSPQGRKAIGTA